MRREKARGPDYAENAFALSGIGRAQVLLGKRALAIPTLRRATKLLEESGLDADLLAATQAALTKAQPGRM